MGQWVKTLTLWGEYHPNYINHGPWRGGKGENSLSYQEPNKGLSDIPWINHGSLIRGWHYSFSAVPGEPLWRTFVQKALDRILANEAWWWTWPVRKFVDLSMKSGDFLGFKQQRIVIF